MEGGKEDVKLLGAWPSPFVMRVRFALNIKKVPYEFVTTNPFEKPEILVKANPIYKKIPVLIHGDRNICESMIIVEYVDGTWKDNGPTIMPSDPHDVAMARFWATFIDTKFVPSLLGVVTAETAEDVAAPAEQVVGALQLLEEAFDKCSKGKAFFGGENVGFLDVALGAFIVWLRAAGKSCGKELLDKEKVPLLAGWAERFCAEEAAKGVMPDTDKLVNFFHKFLRPVLRGEKVSFEKK